MKKFLIQIIVLLVVVFAGLLSIFSPASLGLSSIVPGGGVPGGVSNMTSDVIYKQIDFADPQSGSIIHSIVAEVSDTPEKRGRGLSYRDSMDQNTGMLFLFENTSQYTFIMTGMRFPLDFLWIRDDRIVDISENIPIDPAQKPEEASQKYPSKVEVNKVIELNAGFVQAHKLKVGDIVQIRELTQ
jgi:uncharacterized protein